MTQKKILPVTVVRCRGAYDVRLAGRLIGIRTRAGTWMEARFDTREAAEGYRRVLVGEIGPAATIQAPRRFVETQGSANRKKARL
jgi:hypothetical protein